MGMTTAAQTEKTRPQTGREDAQKTETGMSRESRNRLRQTETQAPPLAAYLSDATRVISSTSSSTSFFCW